MRVAIWWQPCLAFPVIAVLVCHSVEGRGSISALPAHVIGIDHVPVAVRDLDAASERYRRLGFVLKEGRPHANGIRNRHAKFPDGTEIELITAAEATDPLTTRYANHLREGDGPAFLALFVRREAAIRESLVNAGFRASGSGGLVTLSADTRLPYIFFGPRQRSPTDRPEHFQHSNSAVSLRRVWLAGDDLSAELKLLTVLGASVSKSVEPVPEPTTVTVAGFEQGSVVLLPASRQIVRNRRIVGVTLAVRDIDVTSRALGILGRRLPGDRSTHCERIVVSPEEAHGLWLEFAEGCGGR